MIRRVGLLTADNFQQVPFAYELYAKKGGSGRCKAFMDAFSVNVEIEFLGVWFVLCFPYACPGEDY